ncbi:MAG: HDOD domain-containing protein [Rhodoferax sp.]|nr:HDOD domain-containing protein [Rhodoferax sp.]
MELKSLIDQPGKLPAIPKVMEQLIASFSSEDVSISEIASQLSADPALSAKLLKLGNSAYFHVSRTIGTVDAALQMLGFVMVRNLVLGSNMATAFKNLPGIDLRQFWRHNLYTACAARWLAQRADVNSDLVFTLGLMHRIGQLQMLTVMPQELAPLSQQMGVLDAGRAALEQQTFGFHYGQVSAALARIWNFPHALTDALLQVEQPLLAPEFSESAALVHLGAWRARVEILGFNEADRVASYPVEVGRRLKVDFAWFNPPQVLPPDEDLSVMPPLSDLTEGLEAMFE